MIDWFIATCSIVCKEQKPKFCLERPEQQYNIALKWLEEYGNELWYMLPFCPG